MKSEVSGTAITDRNWGTDDIYFKAFLTSLYLYQALEWRNILISSKDNVWIQGCIAFSSLCFIFIYP